MNKNEAEQYVDTIYGPVEPTIAGLCRLPGGVLKKLFESYGLAQDDEPAVFIRNILALEIQLQQEYSREFAMNWIRQVLVEYHEQTGS